jgi:predicted phage tail protein
VLVDGNQIDGDRPSVADELMIERDNIKTIDIYPVMEGAGNILGLILGAVLLVVGIVLLQPWAAGLGLAAIAPSLIIAGIAGLLGGLIGLFDKPSSTPKQKKTQNNPSYLFSGTVNTQDQGGCVPVAYGNVIVGSQCIGAAITNSDVFMAQPYTNADYQVGTPYSARDVALRDAVRAMRGPENRNIQTAAVSTPWNELGSSTFWGYCAKVTTIPYAFDTPTLQQPQIYDNGVQWLLRADNGALWASYDPGGNLGPWDCLKNFPQELDAIILTQNQDNFSWFNPSPNVP